jgi:hypothetical protein
MSSWFNMESLKDLTDKVQQSMEQVQHSIPANLGSMKLDREMLGKLTLTSPELTAERQRIDAEERRKESARDTLAGMLPWETRDPERDILVEECKEGILKLSSDKDTFFGPYAMPQKGVNLEKNQTKDEDGNGEEGDGAGDTGEEEEQLGEMTPPPDSLEKLQKLEPLPPLLGNFDLDSHVGLIEKVLKEDPELVQMQSKLSGTSAGTCRATAVRLSFVSSHPACLRVSSNINYAWLCYIGGGEREKVFWRNYFFHCAYTRYEAGLSIEEIWSDQPPMVESTEASVEEVEESTEEETITFVNDAEEDGPDAQPATTKAFATDPSASTHARNEGEKDTNSGGALEGGDFEMVGDSGGDSDEVLDAADYELDELEAEIARELED